MNVQYPAGVKRVWYDRNADSDDIAYQGANIAPHSATERASYTVPAGRIAFITFISWYAARFSAATTPALLGAYVTINRGGGDIVIGQSADNLAAVNDTFFMHVGAQILLKAGDVIKIKTFDISTGGTVNYNMNVCISAFDA